MFLEKNQLFSSCCYLQILNYLLITYSITAWNRVLLEKLTGSQLVKKFPHFMEPKGALPHSRMPATCPYPEPDHSSTCPPHPTSLRSIIILSSHLRVGLPSVFPTKALYIPLTHTCCMPRPSHSSRFDLVTISQLCLNWNVCL